MEVWSRRAWAFFKLDLTVAVSPAHTHTHTHCTNTHTHIHTHTLYPCTPPWDLQAAHIHTSHLQGFTFTTSVCFCASVCVCVCVCVSEPDCWLSSESEGERDFMIAGCWWIIPNLLGVCLMNVCLLCWLAYFGERRLRVCVCLFECVGVRVSVSVCVCCLELFTDNIWFSGTIHYTCPSWALASQLLCAPRLLQFKQCAAVLAASAVAPLMCSVLSFFNLKVLGLQLP